MDGFVGVLVTDGCVVQWRVVPVQFDLPLFETDPVVFTYTLLAIQVCYTCTSFCLQ